MLLETEKQHPGTLRANVLKVGHHGSESSSSPAFLAATRPRVGLISAGAGNEYGHPRQATLDAGGRGIRWLTGISSTESARSLDALADAHAAAGGAPPLAMAALAALALHRDAAVDALLERRLAGDAMDPLTRHAARWIGLARGAHGFETLSAALSQAGSDPRRRQMLVTGLGQSRQAATAEVLLRVARSDSAPTVRAEAVRWFAVQGSPGAAAALLDIIRRDQDEGVTRRAVASLGEVAEAGVPALIELARESSPVLRREAVGTLTRTSDPRARAFLENLVAR